MPRSPNVEWPLIWSQPVVDKIVSKHHVWPEEVEEALFDYKSQPLFRRGRGGTLLVFARTVAGRRLFIVLSKKEGRGRYKVVTAREIQK